MAQQVRRRKHTSVEFSANNKVSKDLKRGMVIRHLMLRLTGRPTLTNANNTAANTQRGSGWGVVKRIDIVANGSDVIRSISGEALWWYNYLMTGNRPPITSTIGDATTANPTIDMALILPFWMPNALRSMDTALDTRQLSDLKIEVTWGTYTDVNSAATAWTSNPTLEVYALESFNVAGPFSQTRFYTIEKTITASNSNEQIKLPVGPMYRGFMIHTTDAGVDDGDIINNIQLKSGTTVFQDIEYSIARDEMVITQKLLRDVDGGYGTIKYQPSTSSDLNGWYWLELVTDGYMSEAIDTLGFSEFELELDVTIGGGATKIEVFPLQVIPVRGNVNG